MNEGLNSSSQQKTNLRRRFLKDTLQLGSGTVLAQAATIISFPLLSRIFAEEAFGIAALFGSVVLILSTISGLRYEFAILLPEDESDGFKLCILQIILTTVLGLIMGVLVWIWRDPIARSLNSPELGRYLWAIGPVVVVFGILNGLGYWFTRVRRFVFLAGTHLMSSIVTAISQFLAGILGYATAGGLIAGTVLGKTLENGVQGWKSISAFRQYRFQGI